MTWDAPETNIIIKNIQGIIIKLENNNPCMVNSDIKLIHIDFQGIN